MTFKFNPLIAFFYGFICTFMGKSTLWLPIKNTLLTYSTTLTSGYCTGGTVLKTKLLKEEEERLELLKSYLVKCEHYVQNRATKALKEGYLMKTLSSISKTVIYYHILLYCKIDIYIIIIVSLPYPIFVCLRFDVRNISNSRIFICPT